MSRCLLTLRDLPDGQEADARAVRALFGVPHLPGLDVDMARLHTFGLAMAGTVSLSGVQRKLSLGLDTDRMTLRVATSGRQYILKPPSGVYPGLPANEHVTMLIAKAAGHDVPPVGLIRLADGALAYIVRRFDRPDGGGKLRVEDLCQLTGRMPADKYRGSYELCGRTIRRFASEPGIAVRDLYRLVLLSWWTGNGDMHLKNFSLLTGPDGRHRLAPAYDLLNTRLVIPGDRLALTLQGRDRGVRQGHLRRFAETIGLPARAARRQARQIAGALSDALDLVTRSFLPEDQRAPYAELLTSRAEILNAV